MSNARNQAETRRGVGAKFSRTPLSCSTLTPVHSHRHPSPVRLSGLGAVVFRHADDLGLRWPVERLLGILDGAPAYVVGGAVRDAARSLIEARAVTPKDVDVVIDTDRLAAALGQMPGVITRTPLRGWRWTPPGATSWIDVWPLRETVWIRELSLPASVRSFLAGVDLNIDRIAIDLVTGEVFDEGALDAIERRVIDLDAAVRLENLAAAELVRAVLAHLRTGYSLADRVVRALEAPAVHVVTDDLRARLLDDGYTVADLRRATIFMTRTSRRPRAAIQRP
jgi:hypothetical protein